MGGLRLWGYVHNPITWINPLEVAKGGCAENPYDLGNTDGMLSDERKSHILDGDSSGGGHRYGTGKPGKSEFTEDYKLF